LIVMQRDVAAELVTMAEEQFTSQLPLVELMERDDNFAAWLQKVQMPLAGTWEDGPPPSALAAVWQLADEHDARLSEIIDSLGWPGRSLVGEDGADAAWVIAQHADRHQEARRGWLPLLEQAVAEGEADPRHLARLTDRVALVDGRPQSYGTYVRKGPHGDLCFDMPVLGSMVELDQRRGLLGLPPLAADLAEPPGAAPYRYMRTTSSYAWP
jgi:hypothetical protein